MRLPDYAGNCIRMLEAAGFSAYAVGGCVRDDLLGLTPGDFDLCTNALPEQTKQVFSGFGLVLAGEKHGTVGVITSGGVVEITTFRTEGGYDDHRHPQWVRFVPGIEEDLSRRDFTVNAMAWSPLRGLADPFGGKEDLENRILRTVGDPRERFREDALRILRGVRFAVRYGLTPEEKTLNAMLELAPLMDELARERIFSELCKLLPLISAEDLLRYAPILAQAVPELRPMIGFDQRSPHHAFDLFTHTARVTAAVSDDLSLRWAALLHDTGKAETFTLDENGRGHFYGHAAAGAKIADAALRRLKAPNALREQAVLLVEQHMTPLLPDKKLLRRRLSRLGSDTVRKLLQLQQADLAGTGVHHPGEAESFEEVALLLSQIDEENACLTIRDLAVDGKDMIALGFTGRAIGKILQHLLEQVLDEKTENTRSALLQAARAVDLSQEDAK